ncbi:hydantoinase/oxoprolinase family protein [Brevibacterium daeguense]|uniref:Hydantoinase/oxoprolinase family protein n=1 Tax=Brevibacterium daeguense TaxID=909936 RepID=A0ABP8EHF7_9MICO|nr:hydantoinase/oxoprolinase family protein [Brevibacterium daeguense]
MTADEPSLRVGIDIGGTFTDLSVLDPTGIVAVGKSLTTHGSPAQGVIDALGELLRTHEIHASRIGRLVHGTTLVTNALIERRGARTAMLTTEGFRDVIEMGREHRYDLYDLEIEMPVPLVPRNLRIGVPERILATGQVHVPLDEDRVATVAKEFVAAGVEAVAVCFLHSHMNPEHEQQAREVINDVAPRLRVALSSDINPEVREYERFSTTIANVYVQGVVEDYLAELREGLHTLGVRDAPMIMLSNGGVTAIEVAQRFPIRMLESGPAGGALGAVAFGRRTGDSDLLAFDMGGTTAKLCMIEDAEPLLTHAFEVNRVYKLKPGSGLPVRAPVIDMIEIGAGGGSIARVNSLGLISVGPDSAGSEPGPVCYGQGGDSVTVTDADLVLGLLDSASFLGGRMILDVESSREALRTQIAQPLGITVEDAAWGIHATVNANMADAARVHAIERGRDVDRLPLFVSGGNGPLHGPGVAQALGSPSYIVPPAAGVLSTLGFLAAPPSIDVVRSRYSRLDDSLPRVAEALFGSLEEESAELLESSGVATGDISFARSVEMRFEGQGAEIEVFAPPVTETADWHVELEREFYDAYRRRFGPVAPEGVGVEVLTWRVRATGPDPHQALAFSSTRIADTAVKGRRSAKFGPDTGYQEVNVYDRHLLCPGAEITGPALVEEPESTLVIPPGGHCLVLDDQAIRVELGADKGPTS